MHKVLLPIAKMYRPHISYVDVQNIEQWQKSFSQNIQYALQTRNEDSIANSIFSELEQITFMILQHALDFDPMTMGPNGSRSPYIYEGIHGSNGLRAALLNRWIEISGSDVSRNKKMLVELIAAMHEKFIGHIENAGPRNIHQWIGNLSSPHQRIEMLDWYFNNAKTVLDVAQYLHNGVSTEPLMMKHAIFVAQKMPALFEDVALSKSQKLIHSINLLHKKRSNNCDLSISVNAQLIQQMRLMEILRISEKIKVFLDQGIEIEEGSEIEGALISATIYAAHKIAKNFNASEKDVETWLLYMRSDKTFYDLNIRNSIKY